MNGNGAGAGTGTDAFIEDAERYATSHNLKETMESLMSELLLVQPEDPIAYLSQSMAKKIKQRDGIVRADTVKGVKFSASDSARAAYLAKASPKLAAASLEEKKQAGRSDELLIVHFNDVYNIQEREKSPCGGGARFCRRITEIIKEQEAKGGSSNGLIHWLA